MSDDDKTAKITWDIATPRGRNEQGHMMLTRIQGTDEKPIRAMIGELRPLQDGVPIGGEVVKLTPCEGTNHLNVETIIEDPYKAEREKAREAGSRTVRSFASPKYQAGWDRVFGQKPDPSEIN